MGAHVPYDSKEEVYLNNFFTRFPFGEGEVYPEGTYRTQGRIHRGETYREFLRKERGEMNQTADQLEGYYSLRSNKYLDQTPEQFITELDSTVAEVGLSLKSIEAKIQAYFRANMDLFMANKDLWKNQESRMLSQKAILDLNEYLMPVYISLRKKGYNYTDLCS